MMNHYVMDAIYGLVFLLAFAVVIHDVWAGFRGRAYSPGGDGTHPIRWRTGLAIMTLAWLPLVIAIISGGF